MLLIGSHAAYLHFPDQRFPADSNLWMTRGEAERQLPLLGIHDIQRVLRNRLSTVVLQGCMPGTIELYEPGGAEEAFVQANKTDVEIRIGEAAVPVASPEVLASIKRSQLYSPTKGWERHMRDYHMLKGRMTDMAAYEGLEPVRKTFVAQLQERFKSYYNGATKSLKMKNEEFFGNYENSTIRIFEHDDLHLATKYYEKPLYEMMKDDTSMAFVPKKNFERLSKEDQLRMIREECYAIALERVVIPSRETGRPYDAGDAFRFALRRICTNLTRGWFREAAIETYPQTVEYDQDYVGRFKAAEFTGLIERKRAGWNADEQAWIERYFKTYRDEWEYV